MSEMIRRVSDALKAADEAWNAGNFADRYHFTDLASYRDMMARAAIEAMREPTEAMGAAGLMASSHDPLGGNEKMTSDEAEKIGWTDRLRANPMRWEMPVWRAMIDEALKPHPSSP